MQEEINKDMPQEEISSNEISSEQIVYKNNEVKNNHLGPIIGVLIIVLVLILAGLYVWGASLSREEALQEQVTARSIENNEPETIRAEADVQILDTVSTSDEISAIEADIESTNLDSLDAELEEIDRELDEALNSF